MKSLYQGSADKNEVSTIQRMLQLKCIVFNKTELLLEEFEYNEAIMSNPTFRI